jgi:hypothetical protein
MEQFNPPPIEQAEWTCGKGIAANAVLPAALGKVVAAQAKVLELHMRALDPSNELARKEYDTYKMLVEEQQQIAKQLMATAQEMSDARDLPQAPHDNQAMLDRANLDAFAKLVDAKQELLALLQKTAPEDAAMLAEMRRSM